MSSEWLFSAFLIGLAGSVHCVGMCGGIASFISLQSMQQQRKLLPILVFNLGRLTTYSLLGLVFGLLGKLLFTRIEASINQKISLYFGAVIFILLGLYISQIWKGITLIEKPGFYFYQKIQPYAKKLLPIKSYRQLYLYGLSWGLLPCGMVYSALLIALSYSSPLKSSSYMLLFGLGTLPTMLMVPYMVARLRNILTARPLRLILGLLFILAGISLMLFSGSEHQHHVH